MKLLVSSLVLSFAAVPAQAAVIKISGKVPLTVVYHDETKLPDGSVVSRDYLKGTIEAGDSSATFDGALQDCFGAIVFAPGGEDIVEGHGYCDAVDEDGDVWWLSWTSDESGQSRWTITGGTGKYAGIEGTGETIFTMEDFNVANDATPSALVGRYNADIVIPER
jgi:hypothetical protein